MASKQKPHKIMTTMQKYLSFVPSTEQVNALAQIEHFLNNDEQVLILCGSAGTGKTSLAKAIVEYQKEKGEDIALSTPTTRAARIISAKTMHEARTIHARIYKNETLPDGRIKASLKLHDDYVPIPYLTDESSMIGDSVRENEKFITKQGLLTDFVQYVRMANKGNKLIFMGDKYQLAPVSQLDGTTPALSLPYLQKKFGLAGRVIELNEVQRQAADSYILRSATSVRDAMKNGSERYKVECEKWWKMDQLLSLFLDSFDKSSLEKVIYIAFGHSAINRFNIGVRNKLGYQNTLSVGDVVVFNSGFVSSSQSIMNGEFAIVKDTDCQIEKFGGMEFQNITAEVTNDLGEKIRVSGKVNLTFLKSEKPDLGKEQNDALYTEVMRRDVKFRESETKYLFENPYLGAMQLRYGYGITCHKAQGSEFDRVLLSTWTHKPNLPYLYTGITRARKELFTDVAYR
jgi:exodeoxyribonuclease-5